MGVATASAQAPRTAPPELSDDFVQRFQPTRFAPVLLTLPLPVLLPQDINGRHLRVLSKSAMEDIWCPLRFQQRRLHKRYGDSNVDMLAGNVGEAAVEACMTANLLIGEQRMSVTDALDVVDVHWVKQMQEGYVDFRDERPSIVRDQVKACVRHYLTEVVPSYLRDGWRLVALQHAFHERLAPHLRWTVMGVIDQVWQHCESGQYRFADTKFRRRTMQPRDAHGDTQASLYLSSGHRAGLPLESFRFHAYNRAANAAFRDLRTTRTVANMAETWATVQSAVVQITAYNEHLGLHQPWPMTLDDKHWRCSERFCSVWHSCPRGQLA